VVEVVSVDTLFTISVLMITAVCVRVVLCSTEEEELDLVPPGLSKTLPRDPVKITQRTKIKTSNILMF